MDINQLQEILDQITFVTNEAKNVTTKMGKAAKFLATQTQIIDNQKNVLTEEVKKNFEEMKRDIIGLQNKINNRLEIADQGHIQSLKEISVAASDTQRSIKDFGNLLKYQIAESVVQDVVNQVNERLKENEESIFEHTELSTKMINQSSVSIHNVMMQNQNIQKTIEEALQNTMSYIDEKIKKMSEEVQIVSKNIESINKSTDSTLQTIEEIQDIKLWSGKLLTWLMISSSAFFIGVILTTIIAIWFNPLFKAFIAGLLQK